uniref:Uncharacterized protein n=1 Tax=Arundo donax TaxID=35708 RepID=A0A0A9FPR8_ARUDO
MDSSSTSRQCSSSPSQLSTPSTSRRLAAPPAPGPRSSSPPWIQSRAGQDTTVVGRVLLSSEVRGGQRDPRLSASLR